PVNWGTHYKVRIVARHFIDPGQAVPGPLAGCLCRSAAARGADRCRWSARHRPADVATWLLEEQGRLSRLIRRWCLAVRPGGLPLLQECADALLDAVGERVHRHYRLGLLVRRARVA